jgi:putative transposase
MPMRGPKPPAITLTEVERQELQRLIKRHTTPQQIALRARLILAAGDGVNNAQVAHQEALSVDTARYWRSHWGTRWLESRSVALRELSVKERLADAPRSGKPPTITDEQVCQIVALACEAPTQSGRPITQWSGREIAEEIKRRAIVERISGRHAARLLKRGISSRTESATG